MTARPRFQQQGPASRCKIDGQSLGWVSCTAYAMAMGIDRATLGAQRPSGCEVRRFTKDTVEGLFLRQVADVAQEAFGVRVKVRTGPRVCTPAVAARQARLGRGFVLQGNTRPLLTTKFKSNETPANHAVWVNEVRGGTDEVPDEAFVFDPAADHRRHDISQGPAWWPWETVLAFAAALALSGGEHPRTLGANRMYAGFVPRTKTELAFKFGGAKTTPFPDRVRADAPKGHRVNVRRRPDRLQSVDIVDRLHDGELFVAFQRTEAGARPPGSRSRIWYGNREGTEWIHESGLRRIGGRT